MKPLQELEALRQKAKQSMGDQEQAIITVYMGTCGIAAGARTVMSTLVDELAKRHFNAVTVNQSGCAGFCEKEPMVKVKMPGEKDVIYQQVTANKAREIVASHLVNGQVLTRYVADISG